MVTPENQPENQPETPLETPDAPALAALRPQVDRWATWLHARGLGGFAAALLDALEPLAPLGAQALYILQPTLGLLVPRAELSMLATVLDAPGGAEWLRDALDSPPR